MSEENQEAVVEKEYTVQDQEANGKRVRVISGAKDGNPLFSVSADFTDEQVDQAFNLCNHFFRAGVDNGVTNIQAQCKAMFGIEAPASAEDIAAIVADEVKAQVDTLFPAEASDDEPALEVVN